MYKFLVIFIFLLTFSISCKTNTERETLNNPELNKEKHKKFVIEVAGNNYLECKKKIYFETIVYASNTLINISSNDDINKKLKYKLINIDHEIIKNIFLPNYDEIISRRNIGNGLLVRMKITLSIEKLLELLKKSGYSDFNINNLLEIDEEIPFNNSDIISNLLNPKNYMKNFKNSKVFFWHHFTDHSLSSIFMEKIIRSVNTYLESLDLKPISYDEISSQITEIENFKMIKQKIPASYYIFFSDITSIKKTINKNYIFTSLITLFLYNSEFKKLNKNNIQIERVILNKDFAPEIISKEIIERGIPVLFQETSQSLDNEKKYQIVFINSPSKIFIENFLNNISKIKYTINEISNLKTINVDIFFKGSKNELQKLILIEIEKENYKEIINLTNSEKNMIELSIKGVKVN